MEPELPESGFCHTVGWPAWFCSNARCAAWAALGRIPSETPEVPGRATRPAQEGTREVAGVRVADRAADLADLPGGIPQHLPRHLCARPRHHLRVRHTVLAEAALQRPGAHPDRAGDELDVRIAPGERARDDLVHFADEVAPSAGDS